MGGRNFSKVEVDREQALVTLEKLDAGGGLGSRVVVTFPKLGWPGSRHW